MSQEKGQILITIGELVNLCSFAGIQVNHEKSVFADDEDQYDTPIIIEQDVPVKYPDGTIYQGIAAYFEEYSDDGWCPLRMEGREDPE